MRRGAFVNGALVALGAAAIVDNLLAHWLLGLHRAAPGRWALPLELVQLVVGAALLVAGIARERAARRVERAD